MRSIKKSSYISFDNGVAKERELNNEDLRFIDQYIKNLNSDLNQLFQITHGGLRFATASNSKGENIFGYEISSSDTGTANTEFSLSHNLSQGGVGIKPTRFLVTYCNKGG